MQILLNGAPHMRAPFVLTATHIGDAATTIITAAATAGIILICVHDAKVYM